MSWLVLCNIILLIAPQPLTVFNTPFFLVQNIFFCHIQVRYSGQSDIAARNGAATTSEVLCISPKDVQEYFNNALLVHCNSEGILN